MNIGMLDLAPASFAFVPTIVSRRRTRVGKGSASMMAARTRVAAVST